MPHARPSTERLDQAVSSNTFRTIHNTSYENFCIVTQTFFIRSEMYDIKILRIAMKLFYKPIIEHETYP